MTADILKLAGTLGAPQAIEAPSADDSGKKPQALPGAGVTLSAEQEDAVSVIYQFAGGQLNQNGKRVRVLFLIGRAGAGKTTIINQLLARYPGVFTPCATTGRAAVLSGSTTVDRLFSMSRGGPNDTKCHCTIRNYESLQDNMSSCGPCIILDEASMCGKNMADYLLRQIETYDKYLLMVGDWGQASPVKDDWPNDSLLVQNCMVYTLTECHRQKDQALLDALEEVRLAKVSLETDSLFYQRVVPSGYEVPDNIVRLVATNKMADSINKDKLDLHLGATGNDHFTIGYTVYEKTENGDLVLTKQRTGQFEPENILRMASDGMVFEPSGMAIGAQVLIRRNAAGGGLSMTDMAYVNGDTGQIVDVVARVPGKNDGTVLVKLTEATPENKQAVMRAMEAGSVDHIVVHLDRTDDLAYISQVGVSIVNDKGKQIGAISGFPMRLGYAITIHKSQGATLPAAFINVQSIQHMKPPSNHGLLYVAVSRVRKLEDLYLTGWSGRLAYVDPPARQFMGV